MTKSHCPCELHGIHRWKKRRINNIFAKQTNLPWRVMDSLDVPSLTWVLVTYDPLKEPLLLSHLMVTLANGSQGEVNSVYNVQCTLTGYFLCSQQLDKWCLLNLLLLSKMAKFFLVKWSTGRTIVHYVNTSVLRQTPVIHSNTIAWERP